MVDRQNLKTSLSVLLIDSKQLLRCIYFVLKNQTRPLYADISTKSAQKVSWFPDIKETGPDSHLFPSRSEQ